MTNRQKRQQIRLALAKWNRDLRRSKFIENLLVKKGISINENRCFTLQTHGVSCIIKEFKRIGPGGVALAWGCDACRGGSSAFLKITINLLCKLPSFMGTCRNNLLPGEVNKLIVLPSVPLGIVPKVIQCSNEYLDTGKGIVERTVFNIVQ